MSAVYLRNSQPKQALLHAERETVKFARLLTLATSQYAAGDADKARAAQQELIETYGDQASYQQAQIFATWGETEIALDWLDRAYAQRDPGILVVKSDIFFSRLRTHPRFNELLQKMNLAN